MKIIKYFLFITLFSITIQTSNAWIGLLASNWDILNTTKWNEMVTLLETKLERVNILAWDNIILTNSGSNNVIIESTAWFREIPYITDTTQIQIQKNIQSTIIINGTNFLPNSEIILTGFDGTIDNTVVTLWNKIELTLTPWSTLAEYNIIISNEGTDNTHWSGNWVNLLKIIN